MPLRQATLLFYALYRYSAAVAASPPVQKHTDTPTAKHTVRIYVILCFPREKSNVLVS